MPQYPYHLSEYQDIRISEIKRMCRMEKNILSTIKYDSVREVLESVARHEKISRAEIAAETGLSLMTVGKIADALLELGIAVQSKESRLAAGRKAGLIGLNSVHFCVVFDIKERYFNAYVISTELKVINVHSYVADKNYYYDENLCLFLRSARTFFEKDLDMNLCFGVGAVFDSDTINKKHDVIFKEKYDDIKQSAKDFFLSDRILYETSINGAAALYKNLKTSLRILYVLLSVSVYIVFIDGDNVVLSSDIGSLIMQSGNRIRESLCSENGDDIAVNDLAVLLHNLSRIFSPDEIIFETSQETGSGRLISNVKKRLETLGIRLPFTYTPDAPPSVIGIARLLRSEWFDITIGAKK